MILDIHDKQTLNVCALIYAVFTQLNVVFYAVCVCVFWPLMIKILIEKSTLLN